MRTEYTLDYFINKFKAIPEDKWCKLSFGRPNDSAGRHCALGHCGTFTFCGSLSPEAVALCAVLNCRPELVVTINDYHDKPEYPGATSKERILNALYKVKACAEAALDEYERRPLALTPPRKEQATV